MLMLAGSLVPGIDVAAAHVVVAQTTEPGGDCDTVTGFQGSLRQTPEGQYVLPMWWGRDGIMAYCRFDSNPVFPNNPVLVDIYAPPSGEPGHWNVAWGQRDGSKVPVFSNQHELDGPPSGMNFSEDVFGTKVSPNKDVYAFFRAQSCNRNVVGHSRCASWSKEPYIVVHLGQRELTEHL
jgi:hypothetical protein